MIGDRRWLLLCLLGVTLTSAACAGPRGREPAKTINDLTYPEGFGVTLLHLVSSTPERRETGFRMCDAIIINALLNRGVKSVVYSPRPYPYGEDKHAFPSGHASFAFAVAASLGEREPSSRWIAYPLAAAAAWSRESNQKHSWEQVVGGAMLGTFIGRLAGQGKLRLFGHKDKSPVPLPTVAAELDNPAHAVGPAHQIAVWGTSF